MPEDELCGAQPARALSVNEEYHSLLLKALSSIPLMEPGDTIFWHSDVVHAVENEHRGSGYSNGMYIGSAPGCAKNSAYPEKQAITFVAGKTPPDFASDDFEVDFVGRGTVADLTELGRTQLGITAALRTQWQSPRPEASWGACLVHQPGPFTSAFQSFNGSIPLRTWRRSRKQPRKAIKPFQNGFVAR